MYINVHSYIQANAGRSSMWLLFEVWQWNIEKHRVMQSRAEKAQIIVYINSHLLIK